MSPPEVRRGRPRQGSPIQLADPSLIPVADLLDEIAAHVDGTFVVCVQTTGGRYRRRCFVSTAAPERAAQNAVEAGHNATVYLAELKPLWKLTGRELAT